MSEDELEWLRARHDEALLVMGAMEVSIDTLRAERDEARREVCGLLVACHTDPDDDKPDPNLKHIHAGIRGWDCFKEDKEDTDD